MTTRMLPSQPGMDPSRQAAAPTGAKWWTTDLSTGLGFIKWSTIVVLVLMIITIPLAILLYFYWKRQLVCTMVINPHSVAMYQSAGRKINPKVSRYYLNRHAIVTASGTTSTTRKLWVLVLLTLLALGMISRIFEDVRTALQSALLVGLLFLLYMLWVSRYHLTGFNLDARFPLGGGTVIGDATGKVFSLLARLYNAILGESMQSTDVAVKEGFSLEAAKTQGLVALSHPGMMSFIGHDVQAGNCFLESKNFSATLLVEAERQVEYSVVPPVESTVVFCPNCGVKTEKGSKFCFHCGTPL